MRPDRRALTTEHEEQSWEKLDGRAELEELRLELRARRSETG